MTRVIQNESSTLRHSRVYAGIQSPDTYGQVWMPAFAGMTLTFLIQPPRVADESSLQLSYGADRRHQPELPARRGASR